MKTIVRYLLAMAALGAIGFLSGCATTRTAKITKVTPISFVIKVVESSSGRTLPPEEMQILRANLVRHLATMGELVQGTRYYLRVDFKPENPDEPGEWLLVEVMSPMTESNITVLAAMDQSLYNQSAYLNASYYEPYDATYAGGYYRPGTRSGGYGGRGRDGDGRDRNNRPRTGDYTPRSDDSGWNRGSGSSNSGSYAGGSNSGGSSNSGSGSSGSSGGSSYTPPPATSYSPPPSPPSESMPRNDPEPVSREDKFSVPTNEK